MSTAMNARTGRLWRRVLAAATLLVVLVIGVGVTGYAARYSDRALPGTTVGGLPVAGMSVPRSPPRSNSASTALR